MKLATLRTADGTRAVRVDADALVDLGAADLGEFLAREDWADAAASAHGTTYPVEGAQFATLVPRPSKVVCVGLNYRTHITEMGRPLPDHPTLFTKFADTLIGATDAIVRPDESDEFDWEAELTVVIGRPVRRARGAEAEGAIAGFTVMNDVTCRDWQFRTREWTQGKNWDSTTPVGPEVAAENDIDPTAVQVYVGPGCHFVQYALRAGEMFNQVAVFESPKALRGQDDWGTPDELDAAFSGTCEQVQKGLPLMWRDRWWRMFDRDPIMNWLNGRIALLGDAAHPPLQYMAQGAIMAIEDGWVLAEHAERNTSADGTVDWDAALAAYNAVRPEHCRRILSTGRVWGELWHVSGEQRLQRNAIMRGVDPHAWAFTDWVWGPTALFPEDEPAMFTPIPLSSAHAVRAST